MKKKDIIDILLGVLSEETKKIKKKKKKSLISIPMLTRPMGSTFFMDAAVSLSEGYGQKPVTKKFDHLKWPLNQFQKVFLDDFINVPDESLKKEDYDYASNRTGIPIESIKSIKNTYGIPELGFIKKDVVEDSKFNAAHKGITAKEMGLTGNVLPTGTGLKTIPMNQKPGFRNKTPVETIYNAKYADNAIDKISERELPKYMYEWVMFFIEGSEDIKLKESKIVNEFHSDKFDNPKFVIFSFDTTIKESGSHPYDIGSNTKTKDIKELDKRLKEFNETFSTNFVVCNQYTADDGFLKVIIENAQTINGNNVINRKFINMADNDIAKAEQLGFYDEITQDISWLYGN